jgi:hypothetical protein
VLLRRFVLPLVMIAAAGDACGGGDPRTESPTTGTGPVDPSTTTVGTTETPDGTTAGGEKLDVAAGSVSGVDEGGACPGVIGDALLSGTVWAPNGELPIAGAAVYVTDTPPEPVPALVYCLDCIELTCDDPYAITGPDGSFSLETYARSGWLVVQKGQFRRVTALDVDAGETALAGELTTLPDHNDPDAGLTIPRIALALGDHDRLEHALGKLGLGQTEISGYEEELVPGTEPFDVWDNSEQHDFPGSLGTFDQLVSSPVLLEQYQVIFVPCSMQAGEYPAALDDPQVIANIQDWVAQGGKWYVTDWSGEAIDRPFAQYQTFWKRQDSTSIERWQDQDWLDLGHYDPLATVLDPDLLAWLSALPPALADINPLNDPDLDAFPTLAMLPMLQTVYAYSGVRETPPVLVEDGMGGMVDVGHRVWIEGEGSESWGVPPARDQHPLTVSAEYGCGRILFTSYHTVEGRSYVGLTPQELVLMYLVLEISVCQTPYEPPPPVG